MSSGRLWNFVKRCFNWKPLPSGLISIESSIVPNVNAQDGNDDRPCLSRSLGAR